MLNVKWIPFCLKKQYDVSYEFFGQMGINFHLTDTVKIRESLVKQRPEDQEARF